MRIISRKKLTEFTKNNPQYADAKSSIDAWYYEAKNANWGSPTDIKAKYKNASILKGSRVVFNIAGNKYRLVVSINFSAKIVFIRFLGTHKQYDQIDANTI
jgi:mRNA interferase HigB